VVPSLHMAVENCEVSSYREHPPPALVANFEFRTSADPGRGYTCCQCAWKEVLEVSLLFDGLLPHFDLGVIEEKADSSQPSLVRSDYRGRGRMSGLEAKVS
jgi:hypothetical protein